MERYLFFKLLLEVVLVVEYYSLLSWSKGMISFDFAPSCRIFDFLISCTYILFLRGCTVVIYKVLLLNWIVSWDLSPKPRSPSDIQRTAFLAFGGLYAFCSPYLKESGARNCTCLDSWKKVRRTKRLSSSVESTMTRTKQRSMSHFLRSVSMGPSPFKTHARLSFRYSRICFFPLQLRRWHHWGAAPSTCFTVPPKSQSKWYVFTAISSFVASLTFLFLIQLSLFPPLFSVIVNPVLWNQTQNTVASDSLLFRLLRTLKMRLTTWIWMSSRGRYSRSTWLDLWRHSHWILNRTEPVRLSSPCTVRWLIFLCVFFGAVWESEEWLKEHVKPLAQAGGVQSRFGGSNSKSVEPEEPPTQDDDNDVMEE